MLHKLGVDPVVGIDEHQQPTPASHDEIVDSENLTASIQVVRALRQRGPIDLQKLDPRILGKDRTVMPRDDDVKVLVCLREKRCQSQCQKTFNAGPVASALTREERNAKSERASGRHRKLSEPLIVRAKNGLMISAPSSRGLA